MRHIRILSIDGGGMKGLFSAYFMQQFCQDANINPAQIFNYFDLIIGSSVGAIASAGYAIGQTPANLINFFTTYGPQIFTSSFGTPMPASQKAFYFVSPSLIGGLNFTSGDSFYGSGSTGANPNSILQAQLQSVFGNTQMFQFKTNVIITAIEKKTITDGQELPFNYRPVLFSNLNLPITEGQGYLAWQAVMASSSAPTYLPPTTITGSPVNCVYIDGGLANNNPVLFGPSIINILDPTVDTISILSVGCGLGTVGFYDPASSNLAREIEIQANVTDNFEYLTQILDVSIAGPQESANKQLELLSFNKPIIYNNNINYYRFQTTFDPSQNTELDNSGSAFNAYMQSAANAQYAKDKLKIAFFIQNAGF